MTARVLVAEDEPLIMSLVLATLAPLGVHVAAAATGRAALESVRADPPDLMLLDVGLPEIDGYTVCRDVKADPRTAGVRVVLLTARARPGDREDGVAAGADAFVTKPFSPGRLRKDVAAWLAGPGTASTGGP